MPKSFPSPTISPMNHHHHHHSAFPKPLETLAPHLSPAVAAAAVDHDLRLHESLLMGTHDLRHHESLLMGAHDGACHPSALQTLVPPDSFQSFFHHPDDLEDDDEDPEDDEDDDIAAPQADQHRQQLPLQIDPASASASLGREDDFAGVSRDGNSQPAAAADASASAMAVPWPRIDPTPHISSQFYTFNRESHELMLRCILEGRLATPDEIRAASPCTVLKSWRSVWKDRNEDTAYLTAWKRLQDKLQAALIGMKPDGPAALFFKSNPAQRISHVDQWQDIVAAAHADPDLLRHLGLKDTIDRIKQSWTVGAKLYGLPESFIRVCVASCPVCSSFSSSTAVGTAHQGSSASLAAKSKRRRFEYTESFDVPAKDVQRQLQQLAAKHKVVLCIRQKYIRYKPFMAEVKDYACHRAGEPSSASASAKKARVLKREPYQSKRCGCGFRIRAIVPITNYNDKDKTFVYQEEGTAVFKLYAVHSGHEPGPLDGNARIIHRMVGNKGFFEFDPDVVYGVREDMEPESFISLMRNEDNNDIHQTVLQQVQEIKNEAGFLGCKISKMPPEVLGSLSQELSDILNRLRSLSPRAEHQEEGLIIGEDEVPPWGGEDCHQLARNDRLFGKDAEMIEDDDADFGSSLGSIVAWDNMGSECQDRKILRESLKSSHKWMKEDCSDFDEKSILNCGEDEEDPKLIKPLTDPSLVGMQVDGFYSDSTKWYDSPSGLDASTDSGDGSFRHGGIV